MIFFLLRCVILNVQLNWLSWYLYYYKPLSQKRKSKETSNPMVHSPDSLGLQPIGFREKVFQTCGRDINILMDQKTGKNVIDLYQPEYLIC